MLKTSFQQDGDKICEIFEDFFKKLIGKTLPYQTGF